MHGRDVNVFKILVTKPEFLLGNLGHREEDNIKRDVMEKKGEGVWVDWIQRTQDGKTRHFE